MMRNKRMAAISLILAAGSLVMQALAGCGQEEISNSNTSSVENKRRNGSVEAEGSDAYAPMKEIKDAVVEVLGENYWPDKQLTAAELETETGITEEMYEDYLAEMLKEETDIDTMIILKAKAGCLTEIETMLNDYRDALAVKFADRPQELGKVQASRIETVGNYICFVQLGANTSAAAEKGDEEVLALCQHENERAVDRIEKTILDR